MCAVIATVVSACDSRSAVRKRSGCRSSWSRRSRSNERLRRQVDADLAHSRQIGIRPLGAHETAVRTVGKAMAQPVPTGYRQRRRKERRIWRSSGGVGHDGDGHERHHADGQPSEGLCVGSDFSRAFQF